MPDALGAPPRGPLLAAVLLSLAVHAGLVVAAALLALPHDTPPDLIRIALIGGGGGGSTGAGTSPPAAPPPAPAPGAPAAAAVPLSAAPAPAPARNPVPAPRAKPAPPARPLPNSAASAAAPAPADVPIDLARGGSGTGVGSGVGSGTGSGRGPGSGSGSGGGSGSGVGAGHGAGSGAAGDLRALCLSCPEPQYPRIARIQRWEGVVDIDVSIGSDGAVDDANVARSSGYAALDDAALDVARRSRFQLAGATGAVHGRIAYGFRLSAGR